MSEGEVVLRVIPLAWLPAGAKVFRVVYHWTAGGYTVSATDREHYHCILDGDGVAVRGDTPATRPASHTRGLNTGSYGLSMAAMAGAVESPFKPGRYPLRVVQWERCAQAAAEVVHRYNLDLSSRTVLSHSEVTTTYQIVQRGKWDVDKLPWAPTLSRQAVREQFRAKCQWYLDRLVQWAEESHDR